MLPKGRILGKLQAATRENGSGVTLEDIAQAAEANDRFCLGLLSEVGLHVGTGIAGLINLLNPELVILGGGCRTPPESGCCLPSSAWCRRGRWRTPPSM